MMKQLSKFIFVFFVLLAGFACNDEEMPDWERSICDALATEDYQKFMNVCNDYLEQNENEDIRVLLNDFSEWLDDMSCLEARVVCFECLPFDPPASDIAIQFSTAETNEVTKDLVVVSFEEAMFIRVSEVR